MKNIKNQIILLVGILLLLGLFIVPNKIREYRATSSTKATSTKSTKGNKANSRLANVPEGSAQNVDLRLDEGNWRGLLGKSTANVKIYNKGIYNEAYDRIRIHIISYDRYGHKLGERIENLREQLCKGEAVKKTFEISRNTDEIYCKIAQAQPAPCRKNLRETAEAQGGNNGHGHGHGEAVHKEKRRSKKEVERVIVDERSKAEREAEYIRRKQAEARRIEDEKAELERIKRRAEEDLQARIRQEEDRAAKRIAKERRRAEGRMDRFRPKDSGYDGRYDDRYVDVEVKEPRVKKEGGIFGNFFKRSHGYYHGKNGGQQCPYCSEQIGYKDSYLDPLK